MNLRTLLKAGTLSANHNHAMQVRSAVKAGGSNLNHNGNDRRAAGVRRQLSTGASKNDRLTLMLVRAGVRAGVRGIRCGGRK